MPRSRKFSRTHVNQAADDALIGLFVYRNGTNGQEIAKHIKDSGVGHADRGGGGDAGKKDDASEYINTLKLPIVDLGCQECGRRIGLGAILLGLFDGRPGRGYREGVSVSWFRRI